MTTQQEAPNTDERTAQLAAMLKNLSPQEGWALLLPYVVSALAHMPPVPRVLLADATVAAVDEMLANAEAWKAGAKPAAHSNEVAEPVAA